MRPVEGNPLDLNNLPGEDYSAGATAAGGHKMKEKNGRENDEKAEKVYECRFCSLKFGKSQALGGHMNRHRQERETETLNRARQLVFGNDNLKPSTPPHHILGGQLPMSHGGYHQHQTSDPLRGAAYPPARYYCGSSSSANIPPPESYMYPSPSRLVPPYPPSQYYNIGPPPPINDYFVGHAVLSTAAANNYTCIGAPVGRGFMQGSGDGRDTSTVLQNNHNNNNHHDSTAGNSNNNNNNNINNEKEAGEEEG